MTERDQGYLHTPKEKPLGRLVEVSELFNIHLNPNAEKEFFPSKARTVINLARSLGERRRQRFVEEINIAESKKEAQIDKREPVLA